MKPKSWYKKINWSLGLVALAAAASLSLVACQKNEDSQPAQPQGYATTPQPCNAATYQATNYNGYTGYNNVPYNNAPAGTNTQACNNNLYANYPYQYNWSYGNWFWPNQWQPVGNNCGCPTGYLPVYSQAYGVACAPNAYSTNFYVVFWNSGMYGGPAQNTLPLNIPQMTYQGPSIDNSCGQIAQGCDTRVQNCGAGSFCQAVAGGSTIGLCVRQ